MAAYSDEMKQMHLERVRKCMAISPRVSTLGIYEMLKRANTPLDRGYITKLRRQIERERHERFNRSMVLPELAKLEDEVEAQIANLISISMSPAMDEKARVAAGKAVMDARLKLFDAKMDAGIFKRQLGTIDVNASHDHVLRLDPEVKNPIMRALKNYGIIRHIPITTERSGSASEPVATLAAGKPELAAAAG